MPVGRVYQIVNEDESIRYIGSTTKPLVVRYGQHRSLFNRWLAGDSGLCTIFHGFRSHGFDSFKIELIEEIEFQDRSELLRIENKYIKEMQCVNKYAAYTGLSMSEYQRQYREANRDALYAKQNEKHQCECSGKYTKRNKIQHFRSKKHQQYLESLTV